MTTPDAAAKLIVPDDWTESHYEQRTFGSGDHQGVAATYAAGSMEVRVVPARYEATDGQERVASLVDDIEITWRDPTRYVPDVERRVGYVVLADYEPVGGAQRAVYTVAADAGDAVAAAVWLANGSPDDATLHRNVRLHRGDPVSTTQVTVADDDALTALFADEPDRCIFTGNPTRSHEIVVPYRYAPLLDGFRYTERGLPRVPSTIGALVCGISHGAWTENDLGGIDWDTSLERTDPGVYQLHTGVTDVIVEARADAACLRRIGEI